MGWQDAPVVEAPPQQQAGASASAQPAWMSAPAVEQPKAQGGEFEPLIQKAASQYGVPAEDIRAIIGTESSFNPKARSKKGAGGLMQIMPSTASDLGVSDVYDPAQNIDGGTRYYKQMLEKYGGDKEKALAAYNWGPGNMDKTIAKMGDNYTKVLPKETRGYIQKITPQMGIKPRSGKPGDTTQAQDVGRAAAGLYRGLFNDLPDAGSQLFSAAMPDKIERALSVEGKTGSEQVSDREKFYQQQRTEMGGEGIDLGRIAGNMANPAGLALGAGGVVGQAGPTVARAATQGRMLPEAFAKLSPALQKIVAPMLRGAGGAAMMPVTGSEDFASQKGKQIAVGGALGPFAEGAGRVVANTAGRALGAMRGEMQPGPAATQKLGQSMGVQLTAGDLAPQNKGLTGIEGALENQRLPFASMVPTRNAQQEQARAVAQRELETQHKALVNASYMDVDKVRALAAGNSTRSAEARKIVQMMDEAGPDERAIMQASGNNRWLTMKLLSDKRFDKVNELAGDTPVPASSTLKAIDDAIEKGSKVVDTDPASLAQLRKWRQALGGKADDGDPIEDAVGFMEGQPPGVEVIPNTYARMREFRSDLRKRINSATTNETTDSSKLFLKNIAASVEDDMDAFAQSTPKLAEANQIAQDFYKKQVVPYQKQKLASALTADDPDQIYGAFIRAQAEGRGDYAAQRLFTALDGKGKQAVRFGIVKQAMESATKGDEFSPTAFRNALQGTEYKTYFKGADLARVEKIIKLFDHLRHADPEHLKKYSPMLGGQMGLGGTGLAGAVGGMVAGNPVGAAIGAGGVIGGAKLLRFLMTSDSGKRLLFSQNVFNKGGSKEGAGKLLDELMRRMSAEAGTAAGAETGQPGRVLP